MWTTPSADKQECDAFKNAFNAVYAPIVNGIAGAKAASTGVAPVSAVRTDGAVRLILMDSHDRL